MVHKLKVKIKDFHEIFMGHKTFIIRNNYRNFNKSDILILKEWDSEMKQYTGRKMARSVTYILKDHVGLQEGFVAIAIQ